MMTENSGAPLPTGTVTLLFSDIEGSTRLWERHPEAMADALQRHDVLMRSAIEAAGGHVFKTVGDAFCAVFASAKEAVVAAAEAQRALQAEQWPEEAQLRARMAVHTGECEERDGDYFGPAVNRVARLEATAHGGQVVLSQVSAVLVRDRLPAGVRLDPLGSHLLKDMDRPEEPFQLTVEGVSAEFPPLRSQNKDGGPGATGRDAEVAEVIALQGANRLVTLVGPAGTGKSYLAAEVGRTLLLDRSEEVWRSELGSATDSALVASVVAGDLGVDEVPGKERLDTLVEDLGSRNGLLILDNCDHVAEGAAGLAEAILRSCPGVRLIATNREALPVEGEVYQVSPASLPVEPVAGHAAVAGAGAAVLLTPTQAATPAPGAPGAPAAAGSTSPSSKRRWLLAAGVAAVAIGVAVVLSLGGQKEHRVVTGPSSLANGSSPTTTAAAGSGTAGGSGGGSTASNASGNHPTGSAGAGSNAAGGAASGSPAAGSNATATTAPGSPATAPGSNTTAPPSAPRPIPGVGACTVAQLSGQSGAPSSGDPSITTITIQNNGSECFISGEGDVTFTSAGSSVGDAKTGSGTTNIAAHGSITSTLSVPLSCNGDTPFAYADSATFGVNGIDYSTTDNLNVPMFANCPTSLSNPAGGV